MGHGPMTPPPPKYATDPGELSHNKTLPNFTRVYSSIRALIAIMLKLFLLKFMKSVASKDPQYIIRQRFISPERQTLYLVFKRKPDHTRRIIHKCHTGYTRHTYIVRCSTLFNKHPPAYSIYLITIWFRASSKAKTSFNPIFYPFYSFFANSF